MLAVIAIAICVVAVLDECRMKEKGVPAGKSRAAQGSAGQRREKRTLAALFFSATLLSVSTLTTDPQPAFKTRPAPLPLPLPLLPCFALLCPY